MSIEQVPPATDTVVTTLEVAEHLGGCVRLIFTCTQQFPATELYREIRARLVVPADDLIAIADRLSRIADAATRPAIDTPPVYLS